MVLPRQQYRIGQHKKAVHNKTCDYKCDYTARRNLILFKHMRSSHMDDNEEGSGRSCSKTSNPLVENRKKDVIPAQMSPKLVKDQVLPESLLS